ncbi:hypothetical protein ACFQZ3_13405 [Thermocatellispora tengchongensis]|uniref:hypothetical protein n=1 Tax=Thermocatellispora tengchongensis TaxID=1073253 RepID=UPI003624D578
MAARSRNSLHTCSPRLRGPRSGDSSVIFTTQIDLSSIAVQVTWATAARLRCRSPRTNTCSRSPVGTSGSLRTGWP